MPRIAGLISIEAADRCVLRKGGHSCSGTGQSKGLERATEVSVAVLDHLHTLSTPWAIVTSGTLPTGPGRGVPRQFLRAAFPA